MDVRLPKMSGIDISVELRKIDEFKETPIIGVSFYELTPEEEELINKNFTHFFTKPVKAQILRELINEMIF